MAIMYRCGSNSGGGSATPITPDNTTPAAMTAGNAYQPTINGYAIVNYDPKTPSDSSPVAFSSGDIIQALAGGYLYETNGAHFSGYSQSVNDTSTAATSKTISNKRGKTLLLFVFNASSSQLAYNRYDGISVSGGTATKIQNIMSSNFYVAGTFYKLNVTSNTCTISLANNFRIVAYEAS